MVFFWSKNTNKNDDNNKRIIALPKKCKKRIGRGIAGDG